MDSYILPFFAGSLRIINWLEETKWEESEACLLLKSYLCEAEKGSDFCWGPEAFVCAAENISLTGRNPDYGEFLDELKQKVNLEW
jgi:hypothetical protein